MFNNVSSRTGFIFTSARGRQIGLVAMGICLICGCESDPNRVLGPGNFSVINDQLRHEYLGEKAPRAIPAFDDYRQNEDAYLAAALANPNDQSLASKLSTLKMQRDRIINGLIAIDDYNFQDYASRTGLYQRMSATGGDIAVLGLTSAAAVTGGREAKSILAGIAALVTGSRIAVDKEVFYQNTLPVLLDRMQSLRVIHKQAIQDKLATKSVVDYPLDAAIADVLDYFHDGTLYAAVSDIAKDTANKASAGGAPTAGPLLDSLAAAINKNNPVVAAKGANFSLSAAKWDAAYTVLTVNATRTPAAVAGAPVVNAADLADAVKSYVSTWADPASGAPAVATGAMKQFNAAAIKIGNATAAGTVP